MKEFIDILIYFQETHMLTDKEYARTLGIPVEEYSSFINGELKLSATKMNQIAEKQLKIYEEELTDMRIENELRNELR